jgi:hypothetical protein
VARGCLYIALAGKPKDVEQFIKKMAEEVRSKTADDNVKSRAGYLLKNLMSFFPGARSRFQVSWRIVEWPRSRSTRVALYHFSCGESLDAIALKLCNHFRELVNALDQVLNTFRDKIAVQLMFKRIKNGPAK